VHQAEDLTFDLGMNKSLALPRAMSAVRPAVEKIFLKHGAVRLASPLLVPKSCASAPLQESTSAVTLMTHSGSVVTLPHDLRVPFARYVAWNGITSLKRYSIEKVYRERRVFGVHPRELYECAFDIISPNLSTVFLSMYMIGYLNVYALGCQLAEAELLAILWEVINEYSKDVQSAVLRLNHSSLIKAILLNNGIDFEKHNEFFRILKDAKAS
jgi:eukaryotic translation initiation factor 2-alpha kinase 4